MKIRLNNSYQDTKLKQILKEGKRKLGFIKVNQGKFTFVQTIVHVTPTNIYPKYVKLALQGKVWWNGPEVQGKSTEVTLQTWVIFYDWGPKTFLGLRIACKSFYIHKLSDARDLDLIDLRWDWDLHLTSILQSFDITDPPHFAKLRNFIWKKVLNLELLPPQIWSWTSISQYQNGARIGFWLL